MQNNPWPFWIWKAKKSYLEVTVPKSSQKNVICLYKDIFTHLWRHNDVIIYGFRYFWLFNNNKHLWTPKFRFRCCKTILSCSKFVVELDKSIYVFIKRALIWVVNHISTISGSADIDYFLNAKIGEKIAENPMIFRKQVLTSVKFCRLWYFSIVFIKLTWFPTSLLSCLTSRRFLRILDRGWVWVKITLPPSM